MDTHADKPITVIQPPRGWRFPDLREVWAYRAVVFNFVRRNLTINYRQTIAGPIYAVYTPFMTMIGYSLLLGGLFRARTDGDIPYPLFTFSALVVWSLFTTTMNTASITLVKNSSMVQKIYIPRLIFPLIDAAMALSQFVVAFVVLAVMLLLYGQPISANVIWLPGFALLASGIGLGLGLLFAGLHAHFRDVNYIVNLVTRGVFFITPVVYTSRILPTPWDTLYKLNPLATVVEGFRWALLGVGEAPTAARLLYALGFMVAALLAGSLCFRRLEANVADVI
jgi:lipopolysaccharide transport system permease protein